MNRLSLQAEEAYTIRPTATALLCIDSDDRYANFGVGRTNPTYPFTFNIQKNESLLNGFFKRLALTEIRMNWTLPNVSTAWGNNQIVFNWSYNGGAITSTTITISDGFYSSELLAAELQLSIRNINTQLATFQVFIGPYADDYLCLQAGPSSLITFNIQPTGGSQRQLYDMLSFPPTNPLLLGNTVYTGVPSLRATDYVDIVCSQLTNNQSLKDATTAPASRDMIARIYLDESVTSQTIAQTVTYGGTAISLTPTALLLNGGATIQFSLGSAPAATVVPGCPCVISGITGGLGWNSTALVVGTKTTSPYAITVQYNVGAPTGTPAFAGTPVISVSPISSTSLPISAWDDRINGVSPFVIYRQYPYPKQIRWNTSIPIGNLTFELYDDQGRSIQNLWNIAYPGEAGFGYLFTSNFAWNLSILVSED